MLDHPKRIVWCLLNNYFLYKVKEESIDHILLHCVKMEYSIDFSLFWGSDSIITQLLSFLPSLVHLKCIFFLKMLDHLMWCLLNNYFLYKDKEESVDHNLLH